MSLINTNRNYLATMGIAESSPLVGVIVSVYYLGCAVGAVLASRFADAKGRKPGIFACLATASLGNVLMFVAGFGQGGGVVRPGGIHAGALATMIVGRVVMGLGVGMSLPFLFFPFHSLARPRFAVSTDHDDGDTTNVTTN